MAILTTAQLRREYAPPCRAERGLTLDLFGTGRVFVDRRAADAVRALNQCLQVWSYETRRGDTGAYNCRTITGGTGYSLHAYLIALDLNWTSNPYTSGALRTDMPAAMVGAILAIRTRSGAQVWGWGGNYRSVKDAMHFEVVCRIADLASGIDWSTVPKAAAAPAASPFAWVPSKRLQQGSHDPDVGYVQVALNFLRPLTGVAELHLTEPRGYGPLTVAAVKAFQRFARSMQVLAGETREGNLLDVDGVWGPATANAARFWLPTAITRAKAAA